jgi:hypothetical protein
MRRFSGARRGLPKSRTVVIVKNLFAGYMSVETVAIHLLYINNVGYELLNREFVEVFDESGVVITEWM